MTKDLEKRMQETMARRAKKVENLYKEKAINILQSAEKKFMLHPRKASCVVSLKLSMNEREIFYAYLRKLATEEEWKFHVYSREGFLGKMYITIYLHEANEWEMSRIEDEYFWMLSKYVND